MSQSLPITPSGLKEIEKEVRFLESETIPAMSKEIEIARGFGDLSENAEYHAVKERLHQVQKRMRYLQKAIKSAQVIDPKSLSGKKIMFGATVHLFCEKTNQLLQYQIVGDTESDAKKNKISVLSALARGLIGKEEGEDVVITTPGGESAYNIKSVEYMVDL